MIRPVTCVCVLLAGASGLYLYQAKHRVQLLDRQIEGTVRATQAARERTGVVKAEWTLLNDPERLSQLAGRFLPLKTVTPGQFTTFAELDHRLPPVPAPEIPTLEQQPLESQSEPIAQAPEPPPPAPPAQIAAAPVPKPVTEKPSTPKVASVPVRSERAPEQKREPTKLVSAPAESPPVRVATHSAIAPVAAVAMPTPRPVPAVSYTAKPAAVREPVSHLARTTPAEPAAPTTASVLGMARTALAPPVPVSVAAAGAYNPSTNNGN